jgi:hypothetical protein
LLEKDISDKVIELWCKEVSLNYGNDKIFLSVTDLVDSDKTVISHGILLQKL